MGLMLLWVQYCSGTSIKGYAQEGLYIVSLSLCPVRTWRTRSTATGHPSSTLIGCEVIAARLAMVRVTVVVITPGRDRDNNEEGGGGGVLVLTNFPDNDNNDDDAGAPASVMREPPVVRLAVLLFVLHNHPKRNKTSQQRCHEAFNAAVASVEDDGD